MYVWIEGDLVLELSQVVAVTGAGTPREDGAGRKKESAPRTLIHLANGRVVDVRTAKESVVRKIRVEHL